MFYIRDNMYIMNNFNILDYMNDKEKDIYNKYKNIIPFPTLKFAEDLGYEVFSFEVDETNKNTQLTEAQKQDEISLHMMGFTKACTNEIMIEVLGEILGLE